MREYRQPRDYAQQNRSPSLRWLPLLPLRRRFRGVGTDKKKERGGKRPIHSLARTSNQVVLALVLHFSICLQTGLLAISDPRVVTHFTVR